MCRTLVAPLVALIAFISPLPLLSADQAVPGWGNFINPDMDCSFTHDKGKLTLSVPGTPHDLGIERGQMNAPRVLQAVKGDFVVQVKVSGKFGPGAQLLNDRLPYHGADLLLFKDEQTYIRIGRGNYIRPDTGESFHYANFELRSGGELTRVGLETDLALDDGKDTYLRLERHGDKILGAATQDGVKWSYLEPKIVALPAHLLVGVAAVNTSGQAFAPMFSEFKLFKETNSRRKQNKQHPADGQSAN